MNQKLSLLQLTRSVSCVLTADTRLSNDGYRYTMTTHLVRTIPMRHARHISPHASRLVVSSLRR
jgi:hypothetical protein